MNKISEKPKTVKTTARTTNISKPTQIKKEQSTDTTKGVLPTSNDKRFEDA